MTRRTSASTRMVTVQDMFVPPSYGSYCHYWPHALDRDTATPSDDDAVH